MGRSRAAEGIQYELTGIVALLNGDRPEQIRHTGVHYPLDAGGSFLNRQPERVGYVYPDRLTRLFPVQHQFTAKKPVRVDNAEDHVGIGYGRTFSTTAITGGPRLSPRAFRSDKYVPAFLNACDGPTAGADGAHVQHGKQQVVFIRHGFPAQARFARCNNSHVRGCTPHIERDDVFVAAQITHVFRCGDPTGRTGEQ